MELSKEYIDFLGVKISDDKIKFQEHIVKKIMDFPDKLEDKKTPQTFLGFLNYDRMYIKDLGKLTGPLYNKLKPTGQRFFNSADIKLIQKIKSMCNYLPTWTLPLETNYKIVEIDSSEERWGVVLYCKPSQYSEKSTERICRYSSGKYKEKGQFSFLDFEILGVINAINSFRLS